MGREYIFLFKAVFFGLGALILIPKEQYRKFMLYGFALGAIPQILVVIIFSGLFHWYRYQNMGVFNVGGLSTFWSPLAWMFALMFFLYLLPRRRIFFYLYIAAFSLFGYMVGLVLENFRVFKYIGVFKYLALLAYICWFGLAALIYMRQEHIELK
jgi:hypothetical protein